MEMPIQQEIATGIARRIAKGIAIAIAAIIGMTIFVFLGGKIVQLLWNWLMPMLFGLREVTFWQAVGILALSRILFGGFGFGGHRSRGRWDRHMSSEERERFRQRMRDRCGSPAAPMWDDVEKPRNEPPAPATS